MIIKDARFARYSKNLCWFVALIWLLLSVLTFSGSGENAVLNGFLWLAGAFAFAVSAIFLARSGSSSSTENSGQDSD